MSDHLHAFLAAVRAALGSAPDDIEPGKWHRFPTNGRRSDTAGWCKLFDDGRAGVFGCMRQGINEVWTAQDRRHLNPTARAELARQMEAARLEREAEQRRQWLSNAAKLARLWQACVPLSPGDPVTLYLRRRLRDAPWPLPSALRFHPALPYWHDGQVIGTHPAMVAAVTRPAGDLVALHRTWLTRDGRKADVPTVRKLTAAAGPVLGSCIRLGEPTPAGCIGIAEGIETSLGAWLASGLPVCAAYSAAALSAWQWPDAARALVIFADHDPAGAAAAERLQQRARAAGLRVEVSTPTTPGTDWCDVWANREQEAPA
ncbi:MAG: toprim domain-containing protein [Burkholderiaceae bacterium]|nr:toprim domain-containing protein [Burkholderiaceae bacterium]